MAAVPARRLITIGGLSVAFLAMTIALAAGSFSQLDLQIAQAMHRAWQPGLAPLFQSLAELGSAELTSALMAVLVVYLVRGGFGVDAWAVGAFVVAQVLEVLYKSFFHHPGPPRSLSQADGPSLTSLLTASGAGNSFPSGHVLRSVIAFGLVSFVVWRLSSTAWVKRLALALAVLIIALVALDRLYLDVHWLSDVVGALLLGTIALLAATVWLDRPLSPAN